MSPELVVRVEGRVTGRWWLWPGLTLIKIGAWMVSRLGVDVRVDEGPWERVWPRR